MLKLFSDSMPEQIKTSILTNDKEELKKLSKTGLYSLYLKQILSLIESTAVFQHSTDELVSKIRKVTSEFNTTFKDPKEIAKLGTSVTERGKKLSDELCTLENETNDILRKSDDVYYAVTNYINKTSEVFIEIKEAYFEAVTQEVYTKIKESSSQKLGSNEKNQINSIILCKHYPELIATCGLFNIDADLLNYKINDPSLSQFATSVVTTAILLSHLQSNQTLSSNLADLKKIIKKIQKGSKRFIIGYDKDLYGASKNVIESVHKQTSYGLKECKALSERVQFFIDEAESFIEKCTESMNKNAPQENS